MEGETVLIAAASRGHEGVVRALLAECAEVDTARASDGSTALHVAAQAGNVSTIKALLEPGAEVDAGSTHGCTPLHLAVREGHVGVVQALLSAGASHAAVMQGFPPSMPAAYQGRLQGVLGLIWPCVLCSLQPQTATLPLSRRCYQQVQQSTGKPAAVMLRPQAAAGQHCTLQHVADMSRLSSC